MNRYETARRCRALANELRTVADRDVAEGRVADGLAAAVTVIKRFRREVIE